MFKIEDLQVEKSLCKHNAAETHHDMFNNQVLLDASTTCAYGARDWHLKEHSNEDESNTEDCVEKHT